MKNRLPFLSLLIFASIGIVIALFLSQLHYSLSFGKTLSFQFCQKGCDTVNTSSYSELFGIPLSSYGAVLYSTIFLLALLGLLTTGTLLDELLLSLVFLLSFFCLGTSFVLAGISIFKLSSFCNLCGVTYLINLALVLVSGRSLKSPSQTPFKAVITTLGSVLKTYDLKRNPEAYYQKTIAMLIFLIFFLSLSSGIAISFFHSEKYTVIDKGKIQKFLENYDSLPRLGVKTEGSPFKGSEKPRVTLVVFSDFTCGYCRTASKILDRLLPEYRKELQIVYKHEPHDKTCNLHEEFVSPKKSCELSKASLCAHTYGKFWEYHNLLFEPQQGARPEELSDLAQKAGIRREDFEKCMQDPSTDGILLRDIEEAYRLGVKSTPTFFLNGKMIQGLPPTPLLHTLIQRELRKNSGR